MNVLPLATDVEGLVLRGTLYLPPGEGPHPVVLMHHGFSANRIEAFALFPQLARRLTARGFAAAAYDFAGHGESDGDFADLTPSGEVRQAHRLLESLIARPDIDAERVHLLGQSLGAVVASVVAAETTTPVRSLTLWAPPAILHDHALSGGFAGRPLADVLVDGWIDTAGTRLSTAFLEDSKTFDPYERARGFAGPVRLLAGDIDDVIPRQYAERYRETYGDRVEITIVEGGDHLWSTASRVRNTLFDETERFIASAG